MDNLSKTLRQEKMSARRGKVLADLTVPTLENIWNEHNFWLAIQKMKVSVNKIKAISTPVLPKKQRKPNYSILHSVTRNPKATAAAGFPEKLYKYRESIYHQALNYVVNAIKDRFDQPKFKLFTQAEQLFLKAVSKQDITEELKVLETYFKGDYDADSLTSELQLLPTIFECEPINLEEVVKVLKLLSRQKRLFAANAAHLRGLLIVQKD